MQKSAIHKLSKTKGAKYIPIARRRDKPDAIYWLLRTYPGINDSTIAKLIGTTKNTINNERHKTHWNMQNIRPRDPVLIGLCKQNTLTELIEKEYTPPQEQDE